MITNQKELKETELCILILERRLTMAEQLITAGEAATTLGVTTTIPSNKCITRAEFDELLYGTGYYDPATAPIGIYIVHTNGKVYPRANWKTSENNKAVGIGVKTSKCSFVIAPDEQTSIQWGGYGTLINGCTTTTSSATAQTDYKGKTNTDAIIAQLGTTTEYAARYCHNYAFKNGAVGYQPALGELYEAYQNKSEIDACMSLIGGKALYDSSINNYGKWSSTQYDAYNAWRLDWNNGFVISINKASSNSNSCARPFAAFQ